MDLVNFELSESKTEQSQILIQKQDRFTNLDTLSDVTFQDIIYY